MKGKLALLGLTTSFLVIAMLLTRGENKNPSPKLEVAQQQISAEVKPSPTATDKPTRQIGDPCVIPTLQESELKQINDCTNSAFRYYLDRWVNEQVMSAAEVSRTDNVPQLQVIRDRQRKTISALAWEIGNGKGEESEKVRRELMLRLHVLQVAEAVIQEQQGLKFPDANLDAIAVVKAVKARLGIKDWGNGGSGGGR